MPNLIFYGVVTVALFATGTWLIIAPEDLLASTGDALSPLATDSILARLAAGGMLFTAAVNMVAALRPDVRKVLHWLVLAFLLMVPLAHGALAFGSSWWLWLPAAVYLLPLLPRPHLPLLNANAEAGTVKWFNPNKGFGFITTEDGREVFVHYKAVKNGGRRALRNGARVQFQVRITDRGEQADQVVIQS